MSALALLVLGIATANTHHHLSLSVSSTEGEAVLAHTLDGSTNLHEVESGGE